ncbi:MAG: AAA family ATPase, partial [Selenomonadaceae bacterium]|nr:AAA family ATPase [Selenomonadaceae bacterium]
MTDKYKLCIIDNPPDINLSVFNTLSITDDVVIVTTTEKDSLDGMYLMLQQVKSLQQYNPYLNLKGLLINQYL